MSDAGDFFASRAFEGYRKGQEAKSKLVTAQFARLDSIIKAIGGVIKAFGGR